ncbi:hypothetical protein GXP70_12720 [Paenibacillus lycopersici]|uniref:Uncharacterized protein n=1 Tax=Paenibacillus lycopersici TaxID=2704462 RepID=A0A6C0FYZ4_9BACL|nr:hypothetical protein [Paenibacillus lycopersici]QHT60723.1 hypothetical protein GXP70_12720 [Paenibacillus lycopersici]
MPYKPIDFQISIPRTQETGVQQNQLNQRSLLEQSMLKQDTEKHAERQRTRNAGVEQSGNQGIAPNRHRDSGSSKRKRQREGHEEREPGQQPDPEPAAHPFKGRHIDLSL